MTGGTARSGRVGAAYVVDADGSWVSGAEVEGIVGVVTATAPSSSSSSMAIASSLDVPAVLWPAPLLVLLDGTDPDTRCWNRGGWGIPKTGVRALFGVIAGAEDGPATGRDCAVGGCCGKFKASCALIILEISRISFAYLSARLRYRRTGDIQSRCSPKPFLIVGDLQLNVDDTARESFEVLQEVVACVPDMLSRYG